MSYNCFLWFYSIVVESLKYSETKRISDKINRRVGHITNLKSSLAKNESKPMLVRNFINVIQYQRNNANKMCIMILYIFNKYLTSAEITE